MPATSSRSGTNSELHLVDERIVGRMPANLSFEAAAALPLTTITAWEMLFDRLQISRFAPSATGTLLIVGAAGGVGSVMVQLARKLTGLTVMVPLHVPKPGNGCGIWVPTM